MADKARLIGINHVALEVGDVEDAVALYERLFDFTMRGRARRMAFLDMGDQFLAIAEGRSQPADDERHFGLVVDVKFRWALASVAASAARTRRRTLATIVDCSQSRSPRLAWRWSELRRRPRGS